ncbi:MAG: hypothetical protein U1A72_02870 [Sulfuritalea sp.]|nr:hypothetical protein [Sulfuritalea sp.]
MFGFGKDERLAKLLAHEFSSALDMFDTCVALAVKLKMGEIPDTGDRDMAIWAGFMNAICQEYGAEPTLGFKAIGIHFSQYRDGEAILDRITKVQCDPEYQHLALQAAHAWADLKRTGDPSGHYLRLATTYVS